LSPFCRSRVNLSFRTIGLQANPKRAWNSKFHSTRWNLQVTYRLHFKTCTETRLHQINVVFCHTFGNFQRYRNNFHAPSRETVNFFPQYCPHTPCRMWLEVGMVVTIETGFFCVMTPCSLLTSSDEGIPAPTAVYKLITENNLSRCTVL